jgi:formylglycine-generating enzyme required for sulfatase activity
VATGHSSVWLPAFYIDIAPITCAGYSAFLNATDHRPPAAWSTQPQGLLDYRARVDNEPMSGIGWDDAIAYAAWAGKELPTAEQWLRATNGPEGATSAQLREWCHDRGRPGRCGRKPAPGGGFRCVTALGDMLALLAI